MIYQFICLTGDRYMSFFTDFPETKGQISIYKQISSEKYLSLLLYDFPLRELTTPDRSIRREFIIE